MDLGKGLGHLTYSTLVHPADNWDQIWKSVNTYLPQVKARVAPHAEVRRVPAHVGASAETLVGRPGQARRRSSSSSPTTTCISTPPTRSSTASFKKQVIKEAGLRAGLADAGAPRVHEAGREPPRRARARGHQPVDPERAARLQAERHRRPTSSTAYTTNVIDVVAHLVELKKKTGKTVTLGLEPEPRCYLETTDETITYFQNYLFSGERRSGWRRCGPATKPTRARRCATTRASCSTSATSRSATRTSRRRCRSWSPRASRSSSCRKRRRCASPR